MKLLALGILLGLTAGLSYAPTTGRRARSLVRDKFVKYSTGTRDYVRSKARHIRNVSQGMMAKANRKVGEPLLRDTGHQVEAA